MKETIKRILKRTHLFGIASRCLGRLRGNRSTLHRREVIEDRGLTEDREVIKDREIIEEYLSTNGTKKLQIGSGDNVLEGWLNSDLEPSGNVIHLDATKTFPFDRSVFDYVYSEHSIEHVTFPEGLNMLSECYRILKPGGKIRLSTPNLSFLIELYRPDKSALQKEYIRWATDTFVKKRVKDAFVKDAISYEDTFVINNFFRSWGHKFIYDEKLLRRALEKVGFVDLTRCALNESEDEELRGLANESRMPDGFLDLETIIIEGTKPIDSRVPNNAFRRVG